MARPTSTRWIAPAAAINQMEHCTIREITAVLLVCVSAAGDVEAVELLRPSKFPSWDRRLLRAAASWQYRPFVIDGIQTPVCMVKPLAYHYEMIQ